MNRVTDQLAADELGDDTAEEATGESSEPNPATDTTEAAGDAIEVTPNATPAPARRFGRGPRRQKVSKWDRPPDPHDWRFFVGNLGKILIATGLLLFGFVAYQLWGTGIETARAQNRLENEFERVLADSGVGVDETPAVVEDRDDPTPDPEPGSDGPQAPETAVVEDTEGSDEEGPEIVVGEITAAVPIAIDLSDQAVEQAPIPQPFRGDPLFRLEIPAIGRDDIVVPGVSLNDLKDGPGHYPDTPLPGQLGNASVAGHRTTYGAPFFDVDQLGAGDEIITTLLNGDRFVYEVTFVEVVSAADYWVVTTSDASIAELTLTSCHPKYTARDRIVVHSVLNPEKSSNVGLPTFYTLDTEPENDAIPGDDPVLSADGIEITGPSSALGELADTTDETNSSEADPGPSIESSGEESSEQPAVAVGADDQPRPATDEELVEAQAAAADAEPIDAFSQGWFDDRAAFPQIALWGMVLTMISLLAYQISKRFRHDSIGFLFGIAPFLFALYFFFQNVNRLLPPGI